MLLAAALLLTATCARKPLAEGGEVVASPAGRSGATAGTGGSIATAGGATGGGIAGGGGTAAAPGGSTGTGGGAAGTDGGVAGAGGGDAGTAGVGGACAAGSCGPQPPQRLCIDDIGPAFNCLRESDGACRWHRASCTVDCRAIGADPIACGKTVDCMFLLPGCGRPSIPAPRCYDRADVGSVCRPSACVAPATCQSVLVDSCTLATGRVESSPCADASCRDQTVVVCTSP
jgi:hypothetical protein